VAINSPSASQPGPCNRKSGFVEKPPFCDGETYTVMPYIALVPSKNNVCAADPKFVFEKSATSFEVCLASR
jgi:hypothetical protein